MDKVIFIAYAPDNAVDGGKKFVVAANKAALTNKLKQTNGVYQINSFEDIDEEKIKAKFN